MSMLINLENIFLAYGLEPLLDHVQLQINSGERVCLIGRNGAGKSSLLKIIEGSILPDSGKVWRKPNLRIARLAQELPQIENQQVYEVVASGLEHIGNLLAEYHGLTNQLVSKSDKALLTRLEKLQARIDAENAWQYEQKIAVILTRLNLDPDAFVADLSGGWQRKLALAKALVIEPEIILLDEPTNHLDIAGIEWLEQELLNTQCK